VKTFEAGSKKIKNFWRNIELIFEKAGNKLKYIFPANLL